MKTLKQIGLLILEVLFFIVGRCIVFPLLFVVGFFYTFLKHVLRWDYSISKHFTPILRNITLASDGLACAGAGELLNDFYKIPKDSPIRFAKWYQTISAVTGLLKIYMKIEIPLFKFLDILGKNHCVEAITPQDNFYYEAIFKKPEDKKFFVPKKIKANPDKEDFMVSIIDLEFVAKLNREDRLKLALLLEQNYKDAFLNGYSLKNNQ